VGAAVGQAVWPAEQSTTQAPAEHFWPVEHALVQLPQWSGSVLKSVQKAEVPLPQALGVAAGQAQALPAHCWPRGHLVPQAPQLLASVERTAQ
jgi:hypothetical protein